MTASRFETYKREVHQSLLIKIENQMSTCQICYGEAMGQEKFVVTFHCGHYFCQECMKSYIENILE
jgi:hypothetical protein